MLARYWTAIKAWWGAPALPTATIIIVGVAFVSGVLIHRGCTRDTNNHTPQPAASTGGASTAAPPGWIAPPVVSYTPPTVHIPFTKHKTPPTSRPLPVPAGEIARVIEVSSGARESAPSSASAIVPEPVVIIEKKDGTIIIPEENLQQVRVIEVKPKAISFGLHPGLGFRIVEDSKEDIGVKLQAVGTLGLVSFRDRVSLGISAGQQGWGVGASVRVWGHLHFGAEQARDWDGTNPRVAGLVTVQF